MMAADHTSRISNLLDKIHSARRKIFHPLNLESSQDGISANAFEKYSQLFKVVQRRGIRTSGFSSESWQGETEQVGRNEQPKRK